MKLWRFVPFLLLALLLAGCTVNMQRTDMLSAPEAAKLNQANSQLSNSVKGAGLQRALQCIAGKDSTTRKQCAQTYISSLQADFKSPQQAYAHAAHSVRGECSNELQQISNGLSGISKALGKLQQAIQADKPKQLVVAAQDLQQAWRHVPSVRTTAKSCNQTFDRKQQSS